ncbi:helix-turn-helix domain-containing protein [Burkholderia contaminans]|uniref:helix-turn-helix domain-containing protein n=1 Tax=Burkholderia contaminans TaxID=488447 RepID=UPI001453823B|nr:helix-turn-helix domain-containing protein [Burkholderia contaminans]VWC97083.1 AraC family transcriptional regulator [Burkholderia contaminans]
MESKSLLDTYRISTIGAPPKERFDAWVTASGSWHFHAPTDRSISFDCQFDATRLGPFTIGQRTWLNPHRNVTYGMSRTPQQARADGFDHYYLILLRSGGITWRFGARYFDTKPGGLYLIDSAGAFDCTVTTGDATIVTLPRDLFHPDVAKLNGCAISPAMTEILTDYLGSLQSNLSGLSVAQIPHLVQATTNLLTACVQTSRDAVMQADTEINVLLRERVKKYIEENLTDPELSPEKICRTVGISRPRLYRFFDEDGGVMRVIQRKRLMRVRSILADPSRPKVRIADLAWRYGFLSDKHFSRIFKAEFGHSPRETMENELLQIDGLSRRQPRHAQEQSTFSDWIAQR